MQPTPQLRFAVRSSLWLLSLALLATPLAGQVLGPSSPAPSCSSLAAPTAAPFDGAETYRPLAVEERLFVPLPAQAQEVLEIRYHLDGAPYLTETIDLATASLPQVTRPSSEAAARSKVAFEPEELLAGDRMLELLALRPDLVLQLRQVATGGGAIQVELALQGEPVASWSFTELLAESSALASSRAVPLVVQSTVAGPGDLGAPVQPIAPKVYLEDCGDCTTSTPCDTECGWDDGKGGPVTCGEYGICEPATCQCEYAPSYYWTGWYEYAFYPNNPTYYECYPAFGGGRRIHELFVRVFRRDRIERKQVCPNCPSCSGCFIQETVVSYELAYTSCWLERSSYCSGGYTPCCSSLCYAGPFTPCNNC